MNFCSIMPKGAYHLMYLNSPMVMLLTHLVEKDDHYAQLAIDHSSTYKILDNSLIELGGALSMERLVTAADRIHANEIILPDEFKNGAETVRKAKESIEWLKAHNRLGDFKLMAVCHGATKEEFENCFSQLDAMDEIGVIGIPKVMCSFDWVRNTRATLYSIFKDTKKEIHFLGSWYNLGEFIDLPKEVYNKVRSADTCLFALDVIQKLGFYENRVGTIELDREYAEFDENKYRDLMHRFEVAVVKCQLGIED